MIRAHVCKCQHDLFDNVNRDGGRRCVQARGDARRDANTGGSSIEGHMVDALASGGDEGRRSLR